MLARFRTTTPAGFLTIDARAEPDGRAIIDGEAALPGLATRRLRLRANAGQLTANGPELPALVRYVAETLRKDVGSELPGN
jgi:hypothetical protein